MTLTGEIGPSGESGENAQNLVFLGAASVGDSGLDWITQCNEIHGEQFRFK